REDLVFALQLGLQLGEVLVLGVGSGLAAPVVGGEGGLAVLEELLLPVVEERDGNAVLFADIGDRDLVEEVLSEQGDLGLSGKVARLPGHGWSSARVLPLTLTKANSCFDWGNTDLIDQNYRFPEEWYRQIPVASGYEELKNQGLLDWRAIPQDRLIEMVATETQWRNEIRWARNDLRKQHFLDMTAPRGTWKLSHAGLQAAQSSITEGLSPEEKKILSNREESRPKRQREPQQPKESGRGLRSELLDKLKILTHSMPLND